MQSKRVQRWNDFSYTIENKELPKLNLADVFYRTPTAGAKIEAAKLYMNSAYLGLPLEYRTTQSVWQKWLILVNVSGEIEVRIRSVNLRERVMDCFK